MQTIIMESLKSSKTESDYCNASNANSRINTKVKNTLIVSRKQLQKHSSSRSIHFENYNYVSLK